MSIMFRKNPQSSSDINLNL